MSPFQRKRLIGLVLTTVTFALVFANLLPILWMVWCSLKDNGEIMSGKVGCGRRRAEVGFLARNGQEWLAGGTDGGIARFEETSQGLRRVQAESFGTFSTSWAFDGKELWSFSADKGLRRHDASLAVVQEWGLAELKRGWQKSRPGQAWKTVWVNDVLGSSVVVTKRYVLAAFRMENSPGVAVLDRTTGKIEFPVELAAMDQVSGDLDAESAWLAGRNGLMHWSGLGGAMSTVAWGDAGLPWDRVASFKALGQGELAMSDGERILVWDHAKRQVVREIGSLAGLGRGRIQTLALGSIGGSQRLWLGCARGIVVLDRLAGRATDSLAASGDSLKALEPLLLEPSGLEPMVMAVSGGSLVLGGDQGKLVRGPVTERGIGHFSAPVSMPEGSLYIHWRNYVDLWRNLPFGTYLMNSLLICGSVMVISMVLASMAGYALARFEFGGKEIFGYSILATQMIPGILFLIPLYILFTRAGDATGIAIVGSRWGLVLLYSAFYVPFTIWILRGFFAAIPKELEEAALVDGCTPFRAFWSVVLPAALPGIVASGIYVFLTVWDELMFAWILTNAETSTIPVGIRLFAGNYQNRYDLMMAAATVATLPVMLLFFLMQRRIVSGLTAGAVKG